MHLWQHSKFTEDANLNERKWHYSQNNTLRTVDIIFINKLQFLIFFIFLIYETQSSAWIICFQIIPYQIWKWFVCTWLFLPLTFQWGGLIWKFAKMFWSQNFFWLLWLDKPLSVELKTNQGVIFITILLSFHYFISLEIANTQKSEVLLWSICLGNVNVSIVTCWYPQIYNFSFRKEFLEILCQWIFHGF